MRSAILGVVISKAYEYDGLDGESMQPFVVCFLKSPKTVGIVKRERCVFHIQLTISPILTGRDLLHFKVHSWQSISLKDLTFLPLLNMCYRRVLAPAGLPMISNHICIAVRNKLYLETELEAMALRVSRLSDQFPVLNMIVTKLRVDRVSCLIFDLLFTI